ncbi:MAG TPA: condensation domain-containing protein, partial [Herpetosiphonaceae bacterium]
WPLSVGAQLVLVPAETRADSAALVRTLAAQRISVFGASPSQHAVLLEEPGIAACTALRYVVSGGEPLSDEVYQRFVSRLRATLCNCYGPTEATIDTTFWVGAPADAAARPRIGRPLPNVQVYVLDHRMEPVPVGVVGELYVGGAGLARGYHQRPALTAARFVPHPFSHTPGQRLYRTGDLVRYQADGQLDFVDRNDEQVKLRGFRIELGEIEAVLAQHPAVGEVVVLAREDMPGVKRLVAYVVEQRTKRAPGVEREGEPATAGQGPAVRATIEGLRAFVAERLPEYMVPSAFVLLDALPLTANGKIDRRVLPAPDLGLLVDTAAFVAPRTPLEELIAGVWATVLGVERVGVHDNFFTLGGHSLLATQVITRLRHLTGRDLPLRLLFEAPTIAAFAEQITDQAAAVDMPLVAVPRDGTLVPLAFAQQRLWYLHQLQPNATWYTVPIVLRLRGPLSYAALQQSLTALVARHEILRTTFAYDPLHTGPEPYQQIAPPQVLPLPIMVLPVADEATIHQAIQAVVEQPFDLQQGPLLRATLVQLAPDDQLLALVFHHAIFDGWSMEVLLHELTTFYQAFVQGVAVDLPPLPIQYADYALWQRQWLAQGDSGSLLATQLAYWRQQLANLAPLDLPTDYRRSATFSDQSGSTTFQIAAPLADAVSRLSQELGATLFMTLLAAFKVLLARWSGQTDLAVGTPIAGRVRPELEGLIGFFVNTLVLRTDLAGAPSFAELVTRVRTTALQAYAHQDLPFEMVVDVVHPERDLSRHPLTQVLFLLNNTPRSTISLPDLTVESLSVDPLSTEFDLTLSVSESPAGLQGAFSYRRDLFVPETMARMAGHLETLLAAIVADPHQPIDRLPLLTAAEYGQVLARATYGHVEVAEQCVHALIAAQAARRPDVVAVQGQDHRLTYRELDQQANQLAHHLQALGVGPEVIVGVCLERSPQLVVALLAVLKAGGAYLPLDPAYPQERLHWMLTDARAAVLITQRVLLDQLAAPAATVVCLDRDAALIDRQPVSAPTSRVQPDNLLYVIYTSGSTGTPKGVQISQRALANYLRVVRDHYVVDPADRLLQFASISFDASVEELFVTLVNGATLVLRSEAMLASPQMFAAACAAAGITVLSLPTAFWHVLA